MPLGLAGAPALRAHRRGGVGLGVHVAPCLAPRMALRIRLRRRRLLGPRGRIGLRRAGGRGGRRRRRFARRFGSGSRRRLRIGRGWLGGGRVADLVRTAKIWAGDRAGCASRGRSDASARPVEMDPRAPDPGALRQGDRVVNDAGPTWTVWNRSVEDAGKAQLGYERDQSQPNRRDYAQQCDRGAAQPREHAVSHHARIDGRARQSLSDPGDHQYDHRPRLSSARASPPETPSFGSMIR